MDKQLVKRRRVDDDDDGSTITTDRLSQLPEPILHHTLSLLPQRDAIRTCVLSKSWRYHWHGRLNVEFSGFARKNEFWPFLDKTLQRYLDQNFSLQKFLVDIFHYEFDLVLIKKWIPVVIMNMGVRSFTLNLSWSTKALYPLPLVVFQSESLVELHLHQCNLRSILKSTNNVMLNNLLTLHLRSVDITDGIFEKILSGCPLIENLDLLYCSGLKSIRLHKHHKIKGFGCSLVDDQIIIEIEDPQTYESVHIQNCQDWFLRHKNMHFPHLKTLKLYMVQVPAETLNNFSSFFPCVNELILDKCDGVKDFLLLSSSIKRLTIIMDMRNRINAFIDTPNILYFKYDGEGFLPTIKFATTSNEWKSEIFLFYKLEGLDKDSTSWFLKLNKLLNALSQSHITLRLIYSTNKNLDIKDLKLLGWLCKPVVVQYLKLLGWFYHPSGPAILNCFFRICRPRYIHMDCYKKELIEFLCNPIPKEKGSYFWLQDLEEVSIQVWDKMAGKWHCVPTSLAALSGEQPIRFRLTWNEQLSKFT